VEAYRGWHRKANRRVVTRHAYVYPNRRKMAIVDIDSARWSRRRPSARGGCMRSSIRVLELAFSSNGRDGHADGGKEESKEQLQGRHASTTRWAHATMDAGPDEHNRLIAYPDLQVLGTGGRRSPADGELGGSAVFGPRKQRA